MRGHLQRSLRKVLRVAVLPLALASFPESQVSAQAIGERSPLEAEASAYTPYFSDDSSDARLGSFRLSASAAATMAFDSNLFAAPTMPKEDVFSIAEANLRFVNEPGPFNLEIGAFARTRRFMETSDQDTTDHGVSAKWQAPVDARNEFAGGVLAQRRFESRAEVETPNFRDVSFYDEWRGDLSYSHTFSRLVVRSAIGGRQLHYEEPSQTVRDRSYYRGELSGAYEFGHDVFLIGSGYYAADDYRFSSPRIASASTVGSLLGARYSIPDIVDLELAGGYFQRTFAGELGEISGITVRGGATVHPTRLMTIHAELVREDAPTRIAGAFGKIRTSGLLDIRHAYSRSLSLLARGRVVLDDFDAIGRTDKTFYTDVGITSAATRRFAVAVQYSYASRTSATFSESFVRHVMSVSFLGRF
jgi:hypothetical protein